MRALHVASLLTLLWPVTTLAQAPSSPAPSPPPAAAPPSTGAAPAAPSSAGSAAKRGGGDVTRDQYVDRAKQAAERRFDQMDADHDGVLTADERRAYRDSHHRNRAAPATH